MNKTALASKKPAASRTARGIQQIAAGEFKAKCLKIMDEINKTGKSMIVTKRGVPVMKSFLFVKPKCGARKTRFSLG